MNDLTKHPDCVVLSIDGAERLWLPGRKAFRLAKERGFDVDDLLGRLTAGDEAGTFENMETAVELLWVGLLPFEPDLEPLQDFGDALSLTELGKIIPAMFGQQAVKVPTNGKAGKAKGAKSPA